VKSFKSRGVEANSLCDVTSSKRGSKRCLAKVHFLLIAIKKSDTLLKDLSGTSDISDHMQRLPQQPNSQDVPLLMNRLRKCGIYTQWNFTLP
jgi:hypothetical protein